MATRVKKLAHQLRRTSGEVLGLLHVLGFDRFRSPDDMLSDAVVKQVREADRQGVAAKPVALAAEVLRKLHAPKTPTAAPMDPVLEQDDQDRARRVEAELGALRGERDTLGPERDALLAERDALRSERDALRAERDALQAERDARHSDRHALLSERDALVSERDALRAAYQALLAEKAAWEVERIAREAAARIEARVRPVAEQLSDVLLLYGSRRVAFVGFEVESALRRCLDPRIDARFQPPGARTAELAVADVMRTDVVLLCGVEVTPEALSVYATSRAELVRLDPNLPMEGWPEAVRKALQG